MNKLKLKWVSETIGQDYKNWKKGDMVTIEAQTGTGKTYFITDCLVNEMREEQMMIYIVRTQGNCQSLDCAEELRK